MKADEIEFLNELQKRTAKARYNYTYVRQLVADLGINEKRAAYICDKWTGKGWYDYGVSPLAGWLTNDGMSVVA